MSGYSGKMIVFYGINNLGKSTQAKLLVEKLNSAGYPAEYLKYPIYDLNPSGRMLNDYLRNGNPLSLSAKEVQAIYAMNRTQYQEELVRKLSAGINIVAEDYTGTGIAWGLGAGVSENYLKEINSHLIREDLAILFDGERFKQSIEDGHKHENNNDLINKVRWSHLKLKEEYGWLKIDANLKIEEIHGIIWDRVTSFLGTKKSELQETVEEAVEEMIKEKPKEQQKKQFGYYGFKAFGDIVDKRRDDFKTSAIPEKKDEVVIEKTAPKPIPAPIMQMAPIKPIAQIVATSRKIAVEKTRTSAKIPTKAHSSDAGFDLYADDYYSITPYGQALVGSGIRVMIPEGYAGLIWDKSGLANQGITTMGGVIDSSYRGEIKVVIKNLSEDIFNIIPGQKIAQIIFQEAPNFEISEEIISTESERGEKAFGSSGKF